MLYKKQPPNFRVCCISGAPTGFYYWIDKLYPINLRPTGLNQRKNQVLSGQSLVIFEEVELLFGNIKQYLAILSNI